MLHGVDFGCILQLDTSTLLYECYTEWILGIYYSSKSHENSLLMHKKHQNILITLSNVSKSGKNDDRLWLSSVGMGTNIADLAIKTGGGNFSLCLDDFSIVAEAVVRLGFQ